jgi:hypothetical protein
MPPPAIKVATMAAEKTYKGLRDLMHEFGHASR